MEPPPATPPLLPQAESADGQFRRKIGWLIALVGMLAYILLAAIRGHDRSDASPAIGNTVLALFRDTAFALAVFAVPLALALGLGRPSREELYIPRNRSWILATVLGAAWSIALRMAVAAPMIVVTVAATLLDPQAGAQKIAANRPKIENMVDPKAMADPAYALMCMTWLSFVVAGLREELWRAVVVRAACVLAPASIPTRRVEWLAVLGSSVFFGLAHLTMGWLAVGMTFLLGIGLGAILIVRRSLPEAVLAHGFFDATTFFFLYILQQKELFRRLGLPDNLLEQMLKQ